jgi:hypothetical protein
MAKFKPPKGKKAEEKTTLRAALPCLVVILGGMALLFLLFNAMVKSGS